MLLASGAALAATTIWGGPDGPRASPGGKAAAPAPVGAATLISPHPAAVAAQRRGYWKFVSEPRLRPPSVKISVHHGIDPRADIFVAPKRSYALHEPMLGQSGPEILDSSGNPIWELPLSHGHAATNFQVQSTYGQPVLTWWQGVLTSHGIGHDGEAEIFNAAYQKVASLQAVNGYHVDVHEFFLTPRNTAYVIAWKIAHRNTTPFGGRVHAQVIDFVVQELDITTNKLVWQWDPLDHNLLAESHVPAPKSGAWNPFHLNSLDEDADGNLLISARNTWSLYYVSHRTGNIIWRLGGRHSDFTLGAGAAFAWQHDARFDSNHRITLFDNEAAPKEANQSRGLVLAVDMPHKRAGVAAQYRHSHPPLLAGSQGDVERLSNGHAFVGWGQMPYFSEFTRGGRLLFDAHFFGPDETYRALRFPWTGSPGYPPSIAVRPDGTHLTSVYASWNGATRVARWQVLAGPTADAATTPVGSPIRRVGFETGINAQSDGPWFAVQALDAYGNVLGTSKAVERPAHDIGR